MDENKSQKTNWLAIMSILLALLLVTQTGAVLYYFYKKENSKEQEDVRPFYLKNASSHAHAYPQRSFSKSPQARQPSAPSYSYQDPWSMFDQMQEHMDSIMGGFMSGLPSMMSQMNQHMGIDSMPSVDMEEKNNSYIVRVDIPGLDKDKIELTVRGEILTIQGVRETSNQEQSGSYYTQERSYGSFSRSLRLPGPVDDANVKADYQNGVLTITLPKITEEQASKKISVA